MKLAQVVAVHPERRAVDLVFSADGSRYAGARVIGSAGSDMGTWSVPSVDRPTREAAAGGMAERGRTLLAVTSVLEGRVVVLGFLAPGGGFATTEQDRSITRHPSGAYVTIGPDGSMEAYHPSGAYFRIGAGEHADVPGAPAATGGAAPQVTLQTADAKITIKPGGDVELTTSGVLRATYASAELVGDIALTGTLTASVDVVAAGKSLKGHKHLGVQAGTAQTGLPA